MDKQERAKVLDGIEKVVKLNAAGFVVKALNVRTNSFDWFYGELVIGQDQDMEEHFKLCRGDDRIDWPSFREWLLVRRPSPSQDDSQFTQEFMDAAMARLSKPEEVRYPTIEDWARSIEKSAARINKDWPEGSWNIPTAAEISDRLAATLPTSK